MEYKLFMLNVLPYENKDYMYYYYLLELRFYNPSLVLVQPRTSVPI